MTDLEFTKLPGTRCNPEKAIKVIESCVTVEQMNIAVDYVAKMMGQLTADEEIAYADELANLGAAMIRKKKALFKTRYEIGGNA